MNRAERGAMRRTSGLVSIVMAVVLAAAAVALAATGTRVTTHQTQRGKALAAAANGHTLYMFTHDQGTSSRCNGACAAAWPPLLTKGRPVAAAGSGVNAKLLGTTRRANGKTQVTYAGHPLYEYTADTRPGQISGEGLNVFGGRWYILSTSGKAIKPKSVCNPLCPGY